MAINLFHAITSFREQTRLADFGVEFLYGFGIALSNHRGVGKARQEFPEIFISL